uniref:Putative transposase domain-containing protein n=1 Tax=Lutzomyia longipalpis TaxID=7200 RepID=A0A1B0CQS8_LUTLO
MEQEQTRGNQFVYFDFSDQVDNDNFSYSSDESVSSEDDFESTPDIYEDIHIWAVEYNIKHCALTKLLHILRKVPVLHYLPMDARTILETPRHVNVSPMGSGEMWYNGLKPVLYKLLGQQNLDEIPKISLKFHVDGLQIFKSSKVDLWPILCAIEELPNIPPQVIAIYCGNGKPSNVSEYLKEFVPEIQDLLTNGLEIDMYHIKVAIKCFLCDLPARAFLKGNRMSFPNLNAQKRTNESFRQRKNISHHRESSVIERLPVDMVKDFPISDDLHLLHQGVMKRMCSLWIAGRNNYYTKWSANDVKKVSEELVKLNLYKPKELHRQIRDLSDISRWKGTEWRTLLMYTGVVVLRNILRPDVYYNFLLLFCGVTICETSYYKFLLPVADSMLKEFVKTYIEIYGSDEIVMNIHSTIHIVDDVQNHGPLASMSTYIFENLLKDVKQCIFEIEISVQMNCLFYQLDSHDRRPSDYQHLSL